jgi:hypothetical protein
MCYLCLEDFEFELPVEPTLEHKKKRLLKIKSLIWLASQMAMVESLLDVGQRTLCEDKVQALKEEQYRLSRETFN